MNPGDFPPFPATGARGPQACKAVRFYLAIVDDLPFEQVSILSTHIHTCPACATEFRLLQNTTHLIAALPPSIPAAHVDQAILVAIARRGKTFRGSIQLHTEKSRNTEPIARRLPVRKPPRRRPTGMLVGVAVLFLLILIGIFLRGLIFPASNNSQAFQFPHNLSWNGYVLHYTQTMASGQEEHYQVEVYQDLGTNQMHIESSMPNQFDVIVVTDTQTMLGKDMMHHVAQIGNMVQPWAINGSLFDLTHLRQNLATHHMNYLGQETYEGQKVYLVQTDSGHVLLLNMQYLPVNVLQYFTTPGTGTPLYTTFNLMPSTSVSDSMWNMQVPSDFHMGRLPAKS